MAIWSRTTAAQSRAPAEYLEDASCFLEQIDGVCTLAATHIEDGSNPDPAVVAAIYAARSLAEAARAAIGAAGDLIEGRA